MAVVKPKKKIGIDIRKLNDFGIGVHIRNTIKHLSRLDEDFEFYLFHPEGLSLPEDFMGGNNGSLKLVKDNSPNYSIKELITLPCKMFWNNLDLFHSPHYATPPFKPCVGVVTIHDIIHLLFPEFLPSYTAVKYAKFMLRSAVKRAKKIITVSENSKKDIVKHLKVPSEKVRVIYNGVDETLFKKPDIPPAERLEREYGIRGDYILYVGNYAPHKNIEGLFAAFKILLKNLDKSITLVVISGGQAQMEKLQIQSRKNKIQDFTILLGNIPYNELPAFYQGALAFVFPSLYEGFGLPVIESLACGTPAVIADNSSLREVGGDASLYFDPRSPSEIADKMGLLICDERLRENLSLKAAKHVKKFSWEKAALLTKEVYLEALELN